MQLGVKDECATVLSTQEQVATSEQKLKLRGLRATSERLRRAARGEEKAWERVVSRGGILARSDRLAEDSSIQAK